jgi:two-component system sensor histidine kinase KdpD
MERKAHIGLLSIPLAYRIPIAIGGVVAAIAVLEVIGPTVNGATAAQILLLVVLAEARFCGVLPAVVGSLLAVGGFLRYFVTPVGFAFGDPNDIAALVAFVVMAIVGGELALRAERRAQEIELLYGELQAVFDRESEAETGRRVERIKAALLDAMAHNLRTPLTAIKAAVTAILNDGQSAALLTRDEQLELLNVIDEETDRLNRFIGGLVERTEIERRETALVGSASVSDVLRAALGRAETLTRDHRIELRVDDNLPRVRIDDRSLIEVLYILLDNASKYAEPGTAIRVSATSESTAFVALTVSDEGRGIPVHLRERVFERFFRIPGRESHDPRRTGGGVGLALAKQLVEEYGGHIGIISPPSEKGTAVTVRLPIETIQSLPAPEPVELTSPK